MGAAAVVANDQIVGICAGHLIPGPSGAMPAPPLPYAAPLTKGLAKTVEIGGKKAAVKGSAGTNRPPHPGLHASDPCQQGRSQEGKVMVGSSTVFFDNKAAAYTGCQVVMCQKPAPRPGQLTGTAVTVEVAQ